MSAENVKKFYEDLAKDESLQKKAMKFATSEEGRKAAVGAIASFAAASGYDASAADVEEYSRNQTAAEADTAMRDWDTCFCVAGGGGYNRKEDYSCACVLGGGGQKDQDGFFLMCFLAGRMQQ